MTTSHPLPQSLPSSSLLLSLLLLSLLLSYPQNSSAQGFSLLKDSFNLTRIETLYENFCYDLKKKKKTAVMCNVQEHIHTCAYQDVQSVKQWTECILLVSVYTG